MKFLLRFSVALISLTLCVHAQIESRHGGLVVAYVTDNKIAIAADSGWAGEGAKKPDEVCKLAVIGGKVVFATSGTADVQSIGNAELGWSNLEQARIAYGLSSKNGSATLGSAAETWAKQVVAKWNRLYVNSHGEVEKMVAERTASTSAFFAAAVNGRPSLLRVDVAFQPAAGHEQAPFAYHIEPVAPASCPNHLCSIGYSEAVAPYTTGSTEEARREVGEWNSQAWPGGAEDRDVLIAMRVVDLAIAKYGNDAEIGISGPIDAVELRGDGAVRWYSRKPACPAD